MTAAFDAYDAWATGAPPVRKPMPTLRCLQWDDVYDVPCAAEAKVEVEVASGTRRAPVSLRLTSRGMIVGAHSSVRKIFETIERVAHSNCTVLITGERGTGKKLVGAALHDEATQDMPRESSQRSSPLVTIHCGSIPSDLLESELFGPADSRSFPNDDARVGGGATLLFDEVGHLPRSAQKRLLHFLQQREFFPIGRPRPNAWDARIVATTSRDLAADVAAGHFHEDLYSRLNVVRLALTPLRDRGDDVRTLAEHFYRGFLATSGRTDLKGMSETTLVALCAHSWPGNVRSLESAIERGIRRARGPYIEPEDVFGAPPTASKRADRTPRSLPVDAPIPRGISGPVAIHNPSPFPNALPEEGVDLPSCVESYQNSLIVQALRRTDGNRTKAARLLGLNRATLAEIVRNRGL
jgi:DNA-binding NtrC family response regulator